MPTPNSEQSIFLAALELKTPAERYAYLKGVCAANPELLANVQALLAAHDQSDSFLERLPVDDTVAHRALTVGPGTVIGPYKLREQIGEGGFGVVYVAEQEKPVRRKVALKIIKPGMDTKDVIARFEAERQALALMDHPNVAHVLDAGATDSGRPYFVMELVHGVPITEFCDKNKLPTRDRLLLFADICRAVQHAHQKGIIHRDLKPSNIMVTLHDGKPVAKVIDFGVSKALSQQLTEKSIYTAYGQMIGTPSYMSPEQAEMSGLGIDTRSDIYSLGVLLYELLTGKTPLDAKRLREGGYDAMLRMIRDEEPPRPSLKISTLGEEATTIAQHRHTDPHQLRRSLRGELDWIVMKCLEKDRARRYETAIGLARDVERYLEDEPVEACPPSATYRLRKFAGKHKASLAVATAFCGLLLTGVAVSTWQRNVALTAAHTANRAKDEAERERLRAETNAKAARDSERVAQEQRDAADQEKNNALAARQELGETIYAIDMAQVQAAAESRQFSRVSQLLDLQRPAPGKPDYRGFEWHYWKRRFERGRLRSVNLPTTLSVFYTTWSGSLSISRDAARLAAVVRTPSDSPTRSVMATLFDPATGRQLLAPFDPFPDVQDARRRWLTLTVSDDGTRLAVTLADLMTGTDERLGSISIRDCSTGSEIRRQEIPGAISGMALTADGGRIAVQYVEPGQPADTRQARVNVWDTSTGGLVQALAPLPWVPQYSRILLSPDGTRLLRHSVSPETAKDKQGLHQQFQVVNVASGEQLWNQEFSNLKDPMPPWSWSPDGKLVVVAEHLASAKPNLQLWDSNTGTPLAILDRESSCLISDTTIGFSPDSRLLAAVSVESEIYVWEVPKLLPSPGSTPLRVSAPHLTLQAMSSARGLWGLAFGAGGRELHSISRSSITTWDPTARDETGLGPDLGDQRIDPTFSPDATKVAISASTLTGSTRSATLPDAIILDLARDREMWRLKGDGTFAQSASSHVGQLVFSPDGRRLAEVQNNHTPQEHLQIVVHDPQTGAVVSTLKVDMVPVSQPAAPIRPAAYYVYPAFRPDGKRLAVLIRPSSQVSNPPPRRLMVWDTETWNQLLSVDLDYAGFTGELSYSQDGASLIFAATGQTAEQASILSYDAATGKQQRSIPLPDSGTRYYLNVPHQLFGNFVGSDHVIWDLATGQERLRVAGFTEPSSYAISPDGSRIVFGKRPVASRGGESEVTVWSLKSGRQLLSLHRDGLIEKLTFSSDGNKLIGAFSQSGPSTKPIQIWDATPLPEEVAK